MLHTRMHTHTHTHTFKVAWAAEEAEDQKGPRRHFVKMPGKPQAEADSALGELRLLAPSPEGRRA